MTEDIYTQNGYGSRKDYLMSLADDYGIAPTVVFGMAEMLGPDEDFDGLVSSLEGFPIDRSLDCED